MKSDATKLRDLQRCEQFFVLRHGELLTEAQPGEGLVKGIAIHEGLAAFWQGKSLAEMQLATTQSLGESSPLLNQVMRVYEAQYSQKRSVSKVLHVEAPLDSQTTELGGVVDLILENEAGEIEVVDHKSTSYRGGEWLNQFKHDLQMAIYRLLARELYPDRDIKTVIDVIGLPRSNAKNPAIELDWQEIAYDEELEGEIVATAKQLAGEGDVLLQHPLAATKNFGSCTMYGRPCQFAPICFAPPRRRAAIKELLQANGTLKKEAWDYHNRR